MTLSDFRNNTELAVAYYMVLTDKCWKEKDSRKILRIFNDIDNNKRDVAEMIIKDPVHTVHSLFSQFI